MLSSSVRYLGGYSCHGYLGGYSCHGKLYTGRTLLTLQRTFLSSTGASPLTIQETRQKLKVLVGATSVWGDKPKEAEYYKIATSQDEIPARSMSHSRRTAIIPLGSNPTMKEKYLALYGGVRFGRILEDLDTFAVAISYTHTLDTTHTDKKSPLSIVTALVDRIDTAHENIVVDKDIRMTGNVTWAGRSSIEVTMHLDQDIDSSWNPLLTARFLMVARDPATKKAAIINRLAPEGPEEEAQYKAGQDRKWQRKLESDNTLLKTLPDESERHLIHNMFLETLDPKVCTFKVRVKPEGSIWMEETILKNLILCMPEQRNLYNKIFGGFLMRKAYELAYANACLFCKSRPFLEEVDDIAFKKSVEVGSFLYLSSEIVYTVESCFVVKVHAEVVNPWEDSRETTNDFYFIFNVRDKAVPRVIPKTYAEAMMYLDGKRHFDS